MNVAAEKRSTFKQVLLCFLTNCTNLAPSMGLGYSAVALPALTNPKSEFCLSDSQASWFASAAALGTPFGCLLAGPISDRFGRRPGMFAVNSFCFLGWICIFLASKSESEFQLPLLLAGRVLTGFSTGLSSVPTIVYNAEISVPKLRGLLCTCTAVFYSLGIFIIYVLGYVFSKNWEIIALISSFLPLVSILLLVFFVPESPLWLLRKKRLSQARLSFLFLYKATSTRLEAVEEEIRSLQAATETNQANSQKSSLFQASCLKPLLLIAIFFAFQQFGGTFVIIFYAINIIKDAGIEVDAYLTVILIGLVRTVASVILSCLCRVCGIRILGLCSGVGMSFSMILLGVYSYSVHNSLIPENIAGNVYFNLIPICLILFYFLASTVGFLPLPFAMNAECFPGDIRGTASGITCGIGYSFSFVVVKLYLVMGAYLGSYGVFLFYGGVCVVGTVFIAVFVPETKGKSLDEIQKLFETKPGDRFSLFVRNNETDRKSIK